MPRNLFKDSPMSFEFEGECHKISFLHDDCLTCPSPLTRNDLKLSLDHEWQFSIRHYLVTILIPDSPFFLITSGPGWPIADIQLIERVFRCWFDGEVIVQHSGAARRRIGLIAIILASPCRFSILFRPSLDCRVKWRIKSCRGGCYELRLRSLKTGSEGECLGRILTQRRRREPKDDECVQPPRLQWGHDDDTAWFFVSLYVRKSGDLRVLRPVDDEDRGVVVVVVRKEEERRRTSIIDDNQWPMTHVTRHHTDRWLAKRNDFLLKPDKKWSRAAEQTTTPPTHNATQHAAEER